MCCHRCRPIHTMLILSDCQSAAQQMREKLFGCGYSSWQRVAEERQSGAGSTTLLSSQFQVPQCGMCRSKGSMRKVSVSKITKITKSSHSGWVGTRTSHPTEGRSADWFSVQACGMARLLVPLDLQGPSRRSWTPYLLKGVDSTYLRALAIQAREASLRPVIAVPSRWAIQSRICAAVQRPGCQSTCCNAAAPLIALATACRQLQLHTVAPAPGQLLQELPLTSTSTSGSDRRVMKVVPSSASSAQSGKPPVKPTCVGKAGSQQCHLRLGRYPVQGAGRNTARPVLRCTWASCQATITEAAYGQYPPPQPTCVRVPSTL